MADEGGTGERTEEATPKKLKEARDKGQVMKSTEVITVGSLLIMFTAIRALAPTIFKNLIDYATTFWRGDVMEDEISNQTISNIFYNSALDYLVIILPVLGIAVAAGVLLNVVQFGLLFSTKALEPKFDRLNPFQGIKRLFSSRVLFELVKTIGKVGLLGLIIYLNIQRDIVVYPTLMITNTVGALQAIVTMIFDAVYQLMLVVAVLALLDFVYQRRKFKKDMKMSKYEIKMEFKNQEGDPQIKGKIKQKQREMSMMRMMSSVPDADVVITNPTEYAVALKYDEKVGDAPMVVAKGKERIAAKIKEVARENYIPVVENKPLARSIYMLCEVGDFIPVELYQAVAEILAEIFRRKNPR